MPLMKKQLSAHITMFKRFLRTISLKLLARLNVSMVIVIAALVLPVAIAVASTTAISSDPGVAQLPNSVKNAVLQQVSQHTEMPISSFRVVSAEPRIWSDGCFDLADPNTFCTQALVPGWKVAVINGQRRWIYRTDESDRVRLEQ